MKEPPRVLLLALRDDWLGPPRIASRLAAEGIELAALCPNAGPLAIVAGLRRRYGFDGGTVPLSLASTAMAEFRPHRVLPMDHDAVRMLERIAPAAAQAQWLDKHLANVAARQAGLSVPDWMALAPGQPLPASLPPLPLILKPRTGYAGTGMSIIKDAAELPGAARAPYPAILQRYVEGETWTFGFFAERGRLLDGFPARKLRVHPAVFGPSSQLEIREQPAVHAAASRLVEACRLHGLGNMDCQVDREGRVWFLELNPRPPPFLHLGARAGPDPLAALVAALRGHSHSPRPFARERWHVALWPQDWQRDPEGRDTGDAEWDVPEDPALRAWVAKRLGIPEPAAPG